MWEIFFTLIKRDALLAYRHQSEIVLPLFFFILIVSLFPLATNADPVFLKMVASGVIWTAALLSTLLGLNALFQADYLDGTLDQLLLSPYPLAWLVLARVVAHWLLSGLPLILISPFLGLLFNLSAHETTKLFISLLLGTPTLSLMGAMGAALTVGLRNGGILLFLLTLPLYVSVLVFGVGGQFSWLGAFLCLSLSFVPFAIAAALKLSVY